MAILLNCLDPGARPVEKPEPYKARVAVRITVVVLAILALLVGIYALAFNGNFAQFPANFLRMMDQINWLHVGYGLAALAALTIGAAVIIHKVRTEQMAGKITVDDEQWIQCECRDGKFAFDGYIDTSTLDEKQTGYAFVYQVKNEIAHYMVDLNVAFFTPLHAVAAMVYNIGRLIFMPLYIAGCKALGSRDFEWKHIPREWGQSLQRIAKAPFYGVAILYATLYSLFDPMNGRKLGSYLERDWNEGLTRAEGFWSVGGPGGLWKFEGGGTSAGLGKNGFYIAGCWQPLARVEYQEGRIVGCDSMRRVGDPNKRLGRSYKVTL